MFISSVLMCSLALRTGRVPARCTEVNSVASRRSGVRTVVLYISPYALVTFFFGTNVFCDLIWPTVCLNAGEYTCYKGFAVQFFSILRNVRRRMFGI